MSKFVIHKNTLQSTDTAYLNDDDSVAAKEIANGFMTGQPAHSGAVNAILHETSLLTVAAASLMNAVNANAAITPESALADVKTAIASYIANAIGTSNAKTATTSANIAAGTKFAIPYQTAANATAFTAEIAMENTQYILLSENNAPHWTKFSDLRITNSMLSGSIANSKLASNGAFTLGSTLINLGDTISALDGISSITATEISATTVYATVFSGDLVGKASWATQANVLGEIVAQNCTNYTMTSNYQYIVLISEATDYCFIAGSTDRLYGMFFVVCGKTVTSTETTGVGYEAYPGTSRSIAANGRYISSFVKTSDTLSRVKDSAMSVVELQCTGNMTIWQIEKL